MYALVPGVAPTPLDPHERRAQWQLAAVVLALMTTSGGVVEAEGSVARPAAAGARTGPRKRRAGAAGRVLRPPRSC